MVIGCRRNWGQVMLSPKTGQVKEGPGDAWS